MLYIEYLHHRRTLWIAVTPTMVEVEPDELPAGIATFFARIRPVREGAGFQTLVLADAPGFGSNMRWSHILLLNRSAG